MVSSEVVQVLKCDLLKVFKYTVYIKLSTLYYALCTIYYSNEMITTKHSGGIG